MATGTRPLKSGLNTQSKDIKVTDILGIMPPLLKMKRAIDGDDFFAGRVEMACELTGKTFSRKLLMFVAAAVVDDIELSGEDGTTVNTFGVSDEDIVDAVTAFVEVEPPLED